LGFNWIWLDFYVDSGPSSMSWDQVVVATERIGCMQDAREPIHLRGELR